MCLIAFAWRLHPDYPLVMAANRDEFHHRATAPAAFWEDAPDVFGGRDLSAGGSWLALSRRMRLAAVTNVRRMQPVDPKAPSRGSLVSGFVRGELPAHAYGQALTADAQRYAGYNLLLLDAKELHFVTNQPQFASVPLEAGAHAVSNATINTPWPKLTRLREGLARWAEAGRRDDAYLWQMLADDQPASDAELPDSGVGLEMERFLSPPFIRGEHYGTRASTLILIDGEGQVQFEERRFGPNGIADGTTRIGFRLD